MHTFIEALYVMLEHSKKPKYPSRGEKLNKL